MYSKYILHFNYTQTAPWCVRRYDALWWIMPNHQKQSLFNGSNTVSFDWDFVFLVPPTTTQKKHIKTTICIQLVFTRKSNHLRKNARNHNHRAIVFQTRIFTVIAFVGKSPPETTCNSMKYRENWEMEHKVDLGGQSGIWWRIGEIAKKLD